MRAYWRIDEETSISAGKEPIIERIHTFYRHHLQGRCTIITFIWICLGAAIGGGLGEEFGVVLGAAIGYLLGTVRRLSVRLAAIEERMSLPRRVEDVSSHQAQKTSRARTPDIAPSHSHEPTAPTPQPATGTTPVPATPPAAAVTVAEGPIQTPARDTGSIDKNPPGATADAQTYGKMAVPRPVRKLDPVPESSLVDVAIERAKAWILGGNPVTRIGLIVLFCGVAFLLKYAAARNMLPIELRLAAVLAAGIALVVVGWRLRANNRTYALLLQGGGIGVVYLSLFAAAKLYHLLPLTLCLILMLALVGFSAALAILQNALPLAQFGTMGGFLAPVLMSTGSGSHVMLFGYYALLNAGVFAIAWFRAWRSLNLTGFAFTFGIGSLWGATAYAPHHFATTEPFLVLFFVFYVGISILYALRQPPRFKGLIDGTLVFGLPLIVFGLQSALAHRYHYGLAFSALGMGAFYVLLATTLWRRHGVGLRMLVEAFLALGVVFSSVAIPLGLDDQWTTASWAMEGAALVWVGVRQERRLARWLGLLLQLGAGVFFVESLALPRPALPVVNGIFLGGVLISAAGLFSGIYLYRHRDKLMPVELTLPTPVALWGLLWWLGIGIFEIERQAPRDAQSALTLCFVALSLYALLWGYRRIAWAVMVFPLLALLPTMTLLAPWGRIFGLGYLWPAGHLLTGVGIVAWPLAFAIQYRLLKAVGDEWPAILSQVWHTATLLLLVGVVAWEVDWFLFETLNAPSAWRLLALMAIIVAPRMLLLQWRGHEIWPLKSMPRVYAPHGWAPAILAGIAWVILLLAGLHDGDPHPLGYLPLFNPVEIGQLLILFSLAYHLWVVASSHPHVEARSELLKSLTWALAGGAFIFLNVVVARSVHHFAGSPYDHSLMTDGRLHAALSILWAILALGAMAWGARHRQRSVWFAGAGLLGCGVAKLFFIDLSGSGSISRIVSFLAVGGLMLLIGFFAPLPPAGSAAGQEKQPHGPGESPSPSETDLSEEAS
jgi:uncharacterized membrane protein